METKMIKVPFEIETAKMITKGVFPGRIVTRAGKSVRVVCWDRKGIDLPIVALVDNGDEEDFLSYMINGMWCDEEIDDLDLMLEIPEYLTYKEGDIIHCEVDNGGGDHWKWLSIIREMDCICGGPYVVSYVDYNLESPHRCGSLEFGKSSDNIGIIRLATEEEKVKFKERLKKSNAPEAKEYLKRFFGEENSPKVSNSEKIGKKEELAQAYTDKEVRRYHKYSGVIENEGMDKAWRTSEHEAWELTEAYKAGWDACMKHLSTLPLDEVVNEIVNSISKEIKL